MASEDLAALPWRTGRKIGRTIYAQRGPEPCDEDPPIGTLDTAGLAAEAVAAHNTALSVRQAGPDAPAVPDGAYGLAEAAFEDWRLGTSPGRDELEAALLAAAPVIRAAERERIASALAARKETLTRPGWGPKAPRNVDIVPWEAVAEVPGGEGTASDGEALARVRQLAKCWSGLPADTAASLTLRHAGAELLARIAGEGEPER